MLNRSRRALSAVCLHTALRLRRWTLPLALGGATLAPIPVCAQPETAQSQIEAGQRRFQAGDLPGALAAFSQASKLAPRDAMPRVLRGSVYQKLGKLAEAEAELRAALQMDPKLPNAFFVKAELAAILTDGKRPKEAADLLEQLVREQPDHFDSLYNLGLAREALSDFAAAAATYARAVRSKPADVDARLRLTESLRKLGRFADALAAGKEALTLAQRLSAPSAVQAQIFDELGLSQRRLGDLKAAEASFRGALAQVPGLHAARLHLATTLAAAGRCPDALREAEPLPKSAPFADPVAKLRAGCGKN
jgi:tetratricopeptide (TPR) repeat protein